jgi:hypothetical protein
VRLDELHNRCADILSAKHIRSAFGRGRSQRPINAIDRAPGTGHHRVRVHLSVIDNIVHLSVKYSKPERMETTLWTVGRDRHFGQRGGPLGAVDASSDITAYSLDWKGQFASWHLVPSKELLVSINGARNAAATG